MPSLLPMPEASQVMEMASLLPMLEASQVMEMISLLPMPEASQVMEMASLLLIHGSRMSIQVSRRIAKRTGIFLPSWTRAIPRLEEVEAGIFRLSQVVSLPIFKGAHMPLPLWAIFQLRKEITRFNKSLRHSQLLVLHGLQTILGPLRTRSNR